MQGCCFFQFSQLNRIAAKHFDFLLCNKDKLSVLCAIELDDSSHSKKRRKSRDEFLAGVCNAAGIPLIQVPAKSAYTISEIQQHLSPYIPTKSKPSAEAREKICPKCSSPMVKRVARQGKNAGKEFWACSAYPRCKYVEPVLK